MLRILDARTGEPVPATPARRGLTRIEARAPGPDLTSLRVLLTADLLARALELNGLQAWPTAPGQAPDLRAAADALAVRPFEEAHGPGFAETGVVRVTAGEAESAAEGEGPVMAVAPVVWTGDAEPPLSDPVLRADPTALRLALLSVPHGQTVTLDEAVLKRAAERLAGWRRDVAGWARGPSRPVPEAVRTRLTEAWENDLGMPDVLTALAAAAADPALADGARFETFAYADRLLALELARDLGTVG
ncbi:hypothetical protein [Streptomyces murinus]|uniref:hypothetical protein n=1 Tax=Streptomyces murinus TaxID=33900 RepID=UPI00372BE405